MSDHPIAEALQDRILSTISDVLSEHGGGMVGAFVLGIDYLDRDGEPSFAITVSPDQRVATTAGLTRLLSVSSDRDLYHSLEGDDE